MKILHLITTLLTGGAEHLMVDLLPRLCDLGCQVELCVMVGGDTPFRRELQQRGIVIHDLAQSGSCYSPRLIPCLRRLLREGHYDVVHTHNTPAQLAAAVAVRGTGSLLVTTEHNTSNRRRGKAWLKPADRWMYSRYQRIICISHQAEQNLVAYLPQLRDKTITIFNGVDVSRFAGAEPCPALRQGWEQSRVLTMVAGFRYQKDQPTLIRALHHLPERYVVWLVGDGERRAEFQQLIEQEGLTARVKLWGIRSDVPQLLQASDYVIMSSHWEGFGLAAVEGMAVGTPVIASDVPGLADIVRGAGVIFEKENPQALAQAILDLEIDPKKYAQVAQRCQTRARQFDITQMAQKYHAQYKKLLSL